MTWEIGLIGWAFAAGEFVAIVSILQMHARKMREKENAIVDERLQNEAAFRYLRAKIEELSR
jgi:hypothetical protein